VAGEGQTSLQRCAYKALMVVGGGVEEVAEDFLLRPFVLARTGRGVGIVEFKQPRFSLGNGATEIGSDRRKWRHRFSLTRKAALSLPCLFFAFFNHALAFDTGFAANDFQSNGRFSRKFFNQVSQPMGVCDNP